MNKIFGVGLGVLIIVTGLFYLLSRETSPVVVESDIFIVASTTSEVSETMEARQVPDDWRKYQNNAYRFSLFYPSDLVVKVQSEGAGATTITFQNIQKGQGFQIFIIPYSELQVSEARFKKDVPSGVRIDLTDITVDGTTGAIFYSTDLALGKTREVWFIKNGFLYEITTLASLDTWLAQILSTWQFD